MKKKIISAFICAAMCSSVFVPASVTTVPARSPNTTGPRSIWMSVSDTATIVADGSADITAPAPVTDDFKIMLWDSSEGMIPYTEAITEL